MDLRNVIVEEEIEESSSIIQMEMISPIGVMARGIRSIELWA